MRYSLFAAAVLSTLLLVSDANAQRYGRGRGGISIGIGTGGYYGSPGYGYGYGSPGWGYGSPYRSGISFSIGSSPSYGSGYYGGYYGSTPYYNSGYYGRPSYYYSPGSYSQSGLSIGAYSRPYSSWHSGWNSGSWNWANSPSIWTSGTRVYSNPFVVGTPISVGSLSYSSSLPQAPETIPAVSEEAMGPFNEARDAFRRGDYQKALDQVDKAIAKVPADSNLSEFRALCLFAMKDYKKAAQVLHTVLASGPGWNWETIKSLYGDPATYTAQLRALEDQYLANKDDASASFLLAYHYLVLDYPDNAKRHLENVARLKPDDKLTPELLKAMQ